MVTYPVFACTVSPVVQFIFTSVEGECLTYIAPSPDKLPVKLFHRLERDIVVLE